MRTWQQNPTALLPTDTDASALATLGQQRRLAILSKGTIHAEGTVVAQWLTSGLRIAMFRTGWNLLSPRFRLTKVPCAVLTTYYCHGYPLTPKMEDRP